MKRPKSLAGLYESSDYLRLKKGYRLLRSPSEWSTPVTFISYPVARHLNIWGGYMLAGATLIRVTIGDSLDRTVLVYPILFNYRHGLEVAIKWTIEQYGRYANASLCPNDRNHDLWNLWRICKQVIVEVGSYGKDNEELVAVEQIVKDFHDLDKNGMAFRYSRTKDGTTIKLPDKQIDLDNVHFVMEAVDNFFVDVDRQLRANSSAAE